MNLRESTAATKILCRALVHVTQSWTNRGFSFTSPITNKKQVCVLGSIDLAMKELEKKPYADNHPAVLYLQDSALKLYDSSPVTVNDELGYTATIRMMAHAIERATNDVIRYSQVSYRTKPGSNRATSK